MTTEKKLKTKLFKILYKYGVWSAMKYEFISRQYKDELFKEIYELFKGGGEER